MKKYTYAGITYTVKAGQDRLKEKEREAWERYVSEKKNAIYGRAKDES